MRFIVLLLLCFLVAACGAGDRVDKQKPSAKEALEQHRATLRQQLLAGLQEAPQAEITENRSAVTSPTDAPAGELRGYKTIALLAPFSGSEAALGNSLLNAASLALFENPEARISLLSLDSNQGIGKAVNMAAEQSAEAIIGPVRASEVGEAAGSLQRYGAPVFSLSNSANIGRGVIYPMGFAPEDQVRVALDYLARQGKRNLAVIAPDNRYGQLVAATARRYSASANGNEPMSLRQISLYPTDLVDFTPYIERLKQFRITTDLTEYYEDIQQQQENIITYSGIDAILLAPVRSQNLRILAAQLDSENFVAPHVQIVGLQLWDNFGALEKEPSLDSAIWISAESQRSQEFVARYREIFRQNPHDLASIAYDVMKMLARLQAKDGNISTASFRGAVAFDGINGEFIPEAGGKIKRDYYIKRIKRNDVELLN